jgi:hypothetical protein
MSEFMRMEDRMQTAFPDQSDLLRKRGEFVRSYCGEHGWDPDHLTMEQLLKVREQPGWKQPSASA